MMEKKERIIEKTLERLKNNKTVNLIKTVFISFTLLLSSIPLPSVADVNTNPTVTPENGYYFDLGSGQGGWQTDGLWHITTNRAYSPTHSFWYGDENTKTYNTGRANSGSLMSPAITLASNSRPVLYFWSWYQTEYSKDNDIKLVQISVNNGPWTDLLKITDAQKTWNKETIDLSGYAGNTIRLRFLFDTVDDRLNNFEGWYLDSFEISSSTTSTPTPAQTSTSAPAATASANTNLIANPGFETGSTTPVNWNFVTRNGNTPVWDSTTAHSGSKSVKISISGTTDVVSGEVLSDSIPATSGKTYTVSAWGKSQGAGGTNNPAVRVAEFDMNHTWLRQTSLYFPKGTADWNQLQTTFTTGDGTAYIGVYANIWNGYGTFWVDDVSLTDPGTTPASITTSTPTPTPTATQATTSTPTPTPTPAQTSTSAPAATAPADTNLIANPGFETGSTTPVNWNFVTRNGNTPVWESTTSHSGAKSAKISISGTTDVISGEVWSDSIPSTSGKTYTLSAWGKSQGAAGTNNPAVRVAEFDINHAWLRQTSLYFPKGSADWKQLQTTFTTGDGTAYIGVYANIWNGYGTFWVDDVSLTDPDTTPTPAPTATQAPTSTPTPTPTPSPTATPTATQAPKSTPSPTATPTPTSTPAPVSHGPTYYVATNGNDGNSGSSSSPWRTIQHAADTVSAGATVYVMGGTYNEKVTIKNSGSSGNYITFAAYPGQTATIDGTGISLNYDGLIRMDGVSYIKISGFNIVHSTFMGIMISGGASNIIVQNNHISDVSSSALLAQDASYITYDGNEVTNAQTMKGLGGQTNENVNMIRTNNFEIKNNHIYSNANFESIDVKEGSSYGSIHHNDISGAHSAGIYIDAQGKNSQNIDIYQNKVHDSQESGARGIAIGVESSGSAKNMRVYDNMVWNMGAIGIVAGTSYSAGAVDNIAVVNNVVYNNGLVDSWGGGIKIEYSSATNMRIRNNIASQNRNSQIDNAAGGNAAVTNNLIDGSGGTTGASYITGSPQFVNPSGGDFHIQSSSPAIDKGTSTDAPAVDFDGNSRPKGAGYDIGAFEY